MKLMLIGGGETGRGDKVYSTKEIDEEVVKMSGKEKPNFLFIGLASSFSDSYYDTMKLIYRNLGCECAYLKKKNILNNPDIVKDKIKNADIIYVAGGDTIKLLNDLKEYNIVPLIKEAIEEDTVIAGISAGAIMVSKEGYSDAAKLRGESDKYDFLEGLNFIDLIFSPHHNEEKVNEMIGEIGSRKVYSLENNTALKIIDNKYEVIKSDKNAKAYLVTNKGVEELPDKGNI